MRGVVVLFLAALLTTGCGSVDRSPSPASPAANPDIVAADGRLAPVLSALAAMPDWTRGPADRLVAIRALPSLHELCVEVAADDRVVHVTVETSEVRWRVRAVALFDPATGPEVTLEDAAGSDGHLCSFVLLGNGEAFPTDPAQVEVNGPVDAAQAAAIRDSLLATPEAFGIARSGTPAINLQPAPGTATGTACYEAIVYVGAPRAKVMVGLVEADGAWRVASVRIVEQALRPVLQAPPGSC